jgi:WD40 repeat protein
MSAPQLRPRPPLPGHTRRVRSAALCLAVSADGRRVAAGTYDRKIYIWDVARPA